MSIFFAANLSSIEHAFSEAFSVMQSAGMAGAVVLVQEAHLALMERALWQKPQLAFIPHAPIEDPEATRMPFILTHVEALQALTPSDPRLLFQPCSVDDADPNAPIPKPCVRPLLINMGGDALPVFAQFNALLELVPANDHPHHVGFQSITEAITEARNRYRQYRDQGCDLAHVANDESFANAYSKWWAKVAAV